MKNNATYFKCKIAGAPHSYFMYVKEDEHVTCTYIKDGKSKWEEIALLEAANFIRRFAKDVEEITEHEFKKILFVAAL